MIHLRYLLFFLSLLLLFTCSSKTGTEIIEEEPDVLINCTNTDVRITKEDAIVIQHATKPVIWEGTYNETTVKISFTKPIGSESETFTFIFDKVDSCLKIKRAFKFYDGNQVDVSAITEINVLEFYTKEWEVDEKFTGYVIYKDPHDKRVYSRKFWVTFTEENLEIENTNYLLFDTCFGAQLPINLDINSDGIIDFKIIPETVRDIGNTPKFKQYTIKLISTNEDENEILSPRKNQGPYSVLFEPPFTSKNTRQYFNDVKNALDVFYEFDAPYQNFNYFLNNNLTYKDYLENEKDDYYIIKMGLDNKEYYGWIHFTFSVANCTAEVLDTYLNTIADEPISVD
ncbi:MULTISPECIES: hypothetical protein [unclassified Polaribacter]|uniref:hypothetical protein n=1 Tax=unclassified Polaribacter TaxID=196858 RepID=UPI0011BE2637|nr:MULTISPECIES: hypothetical protein [unclassified Polaribacter]TXD52986.1 hypothetical protein ES043_06345 [Polaribacter sp. IC063]TXD60922.1 hypothetical protein ES044_06125 [Polaribacter sp. IC066]